MLAQIVGNKDTVMNSKFLHLKHIKLSTCLFAGCLLSTLPTQAEAREHYTCYIQLEDQSKIIHQFVAVDESKSELLERLPTQLVFEKDGVTSQSILTIYECVTGKQQFVNAQARQLVRTTPM